MLETSYFPHGNSDKIVLNSVLQWLTILLSGIPPLILVGGQISLPPTTTNSSSSRHPQGSSTEPQGSRISQGLRDFWLQERECLTISITTTMDLLGTLWQSKISCTVQIIERWIVSTEIFKQV